MQTTVAKGSARVQPKRMAAKKPKVTKAPVPKMAAKLMADAKVRVDFRAVVKDSPVKSIAGLARKIGTCRMLILQYLKNKKPIPEKRALQIKRLTGWDESRWPGGISRNQTQSPAKQDN